jgi:hypothetical protein
MIKEERKKEERKKYWRRTFGERKKEGDIQTPIWSIHTKKKSSLGKINSAPYMLACISNHISLIRYSLFEKPSP